MSGKQEGATREEGRASVLGDDNPAIRRVGSDRMAAMELLAGGRREEVAREAGVDIPAPKLDKEGKSSDPDAEEIDNEVIDPEEQERKRADAQAAADKARATKEQGEAERRAREDATRRQLGDDDRVVLDGDLSKYFIKGKIDGEEQEIPLDRAARVLQKDYSADKRLEEATRLKKEAEAASKAAADELRAAKARGDEEATRVARERQEAAAANLDGIKQKLKAAGDSLFAGDTEAFTETMMELVQGRATSATPNPDELADAVAARVEQRTALTKFQKDYSEVTTNPYLSQMCDAKVKELVAAGTPYEDAIFEAGDHVREQIKELAKGQGMTDAGTSSTGQRVDRTSRKERIDEPRSAARAQASNNQENEPTPVSTVIDEMRQSRMPKARGERPPA